MQLKELLDMGEVEVLLTQWTAVTGVKTLLLNAEEEVMAGEGERAGYRTEIMSGRDKLGYVAEGMEPVEDDDADAAEEENTESSGNEAVIDALAKVITRMAESGIESLKQQELNASVHANVHKTAEYIQKINDITKQLDKIEKNQKILSLNASIEAARAGEAGKGFAIVATNVASLATDFGNNNREIKQELQKLNEAIESIEQNQ